MKIKHLIPLFAGVILLSGFAAIYDSYKVSHIVYIDLEQVFNEYDMKKEMDADLKGILSKREKSLDSLQNTILIYEAKNKTSMSKEENLKIQSMKGEFLEISDRVKRQNQAKANEFTDVVWKRINAELKNYSEEKNIDFVLGLQGNGNVMYAKEKLSVTQDFIDFLNNKYHDKQ